MKKFLSALMAIVLAISTALAASAAFDSRTAENSTVEIPTLYFDSAEAYERHLNQLKSDVSTHANGNAVISAAVVRSGSSEDCELYIEWDGNAVYSSFRYKQITVKTTVVTRCGERASGLLPFKNAPNPSVVCLPRIFRTEAKSSSLKYRYPFNGKPVCRRVKSLFLMMPHIDKCYFFAT